MVPLAPVSPILLLIYIQIKVPLALFPYWACRFASASYSLETTGSEAAGLTGGAAAHANHSTTAVRTGGGVHISVVLLVITLLCESIGRMRVVFEEFAGQVTFAVLLFFHDSNPSLIQTLRAEPKVSFGPAGVSSISTKSLYCTFVQLSSQKDKEK